MLCTKVRLSDRRRFRLESTIRSHQQQQSTYKNENCSSTSTSTATFSIDNGSSPFVRPCAIIKMFKERNTTEIEAQKIETAPIPIGISTTSDTPRSQRNSNDRFSNKISRSSSNASNECHPNACRTPLICVTLYMPSDAKTLAPQTIKRDHRRQPLFCQNFVQKQSAPNEQCNCKINTTPDFIVRGTEIGESNTTKSSNMDLMQTEEDGSINYDGKLCENAETNACCACLIEMCSESNVSSQCVDKTEVGLNFDNYRMDTYGNLPKESAIPLSSDRLDGESGDDDDDVPIQRCTLITKRACSPTTGQVIRITVNAKNNNYQNKNK